MKKPYIKKLDEFAGLTVWLVDGMYIRKNMDEEFTGHGHHYYDGCRFKFIPKNELWVDKECVPGDVAYYVASWLAMLKLLAAGVKYDKAVDRADMIEKRERQKSVLVKNLLRQHSPAQVLNRIHKKLLKRYSRRVKVWIVNGEIVRGLFYVAFTEGGHDKVYSFVPDNEIWIDDDISPKERKYILLHEAHERNLMCRGWPYFARKRSAHTDASKIEFFCRHHPKQLGKMLEKELALMDKLC